MSNETPMTQQVFADKIGKTTRTLQLWDKEGKFTARRNPAGEPFYLQEDLDRYLNKNPQEA